MENITNTIELKNAIASLKEEQAKKAQLMKEQFHITYESLKPVNIIKSTINDIISTPYFDNKISGTIMGLVSGYISKKIVEGNASGNIFRKILASLMQYGVTNIVAKHPDVIKSVGQFIFSYLSRKKKEDQ